MPRLKGWPDSAAVSAKLAIRNGNKEIRFMARAAPPKNREPRQTPWDTPRRRGRAPSFIEEARRKQILDVSLELIAKKGYDSTSLSEIADAVGVSKGVISYHFDGKSDLGKQVLRHWMRQYNRFVAERLAGHTSPRDRLLELPNACIDFVVQRREESLIYLDTVGCFGTAEERHGFLAWAEQGMRAYILDLIRDAQAANEMTAVPGGPLADVLQATIDGVTGQWSVNPDAVDLEGCKKVIRQMLDSVLGPAPRRRRQGGS